MNECLTTCFFVDGSVKRADGNGMSYKELS
jgi:hypothetical protein